MKYVYNHNTISNQSYECEKALKINQMIKTMAKICANLISTFSNYVHFTMPSILCAIGKEIECVTLVKFCVVCMRLRLHIRKTIRSTSENFNFTFCFCRFSSAFICSISLNVGKWIKSTLTRTQRKRLLIRFMVIFDGESPRLSLCLSHAHLCGEAEHSCDRNWNKRHDTKLYSENKIFHVKRFK